jgi:hypothetical protein
VDTTHKGIYLISSALVSGEANGEDGFNDLFGDILVKKFLYFWQPKLY